MKAIVVTDRGQGAAGMTLTERPTPQPAINDVIVTIAARALLDQTGGDLFGEAG